MSNSVPAGWTSSRLCDLADIRSSNVDKKSNDDEIPVRLCNYTDVYYNNEITNKISFMAATAKQSQIDRFSLECGDVIITKDSETPDDIAIPTYVAEPLSKVLCGYHLSLIRPDKLKANGRFLSHLFGLPKVRHHFYILANGITRYGLNIDAIENAPIQTPPLPEQQKIAAILTAVDEVIASTQAQISKLKDLKTGMMQELLTKGIGHTEFKDSPVGRIPAAWETTSLEKIIATLDGGVSVNSENRPKRADEFGILKTSSVNKGIFFPDENKVIIESEISRAKVNPVADSIVFSRMNTPDLVGESGYVKETRHDLFLPDRLWLLNVNDRENTNVLWLSYMLSSGNTRRKINEAATGTSDSMKNISKPNLLAIQIVHPPITEQKIIADVLQSIDNQIEYSENKFIQNTNTKKALMQDLLTGKVRVRVN